MRMHVALRIDGVHIELNRFVGTQQSFYEPWEFHGLRIWFDALAALFDTYMETHGDCRPRKAVRLAVQDATRRICPVLLHPWCPLPASGLRIEDCYRGEDCWMGPYGGGDAHGGLDINHRSGTPLWTPIAFDEQYFFETLAGGANNNRWRGIRNWDDGSTWILQSHHLVELLVPEHTPLPAGLNYARSAGVLTGVQEHSHFVFKIEDERGLFTLDPWILFWQMYQDRAATKA